ncbi:MAG: hypothetical protein KKH01_00495 [Firmicutes bacterium]|nr:hypothetical protein [Bacillota bacterium]
MSDFSIFCNDDKIIEIYRTHSEYKELIENIRNYYDFLFCIQENNFHQIVTISMIENIPSLVKINNENYRTLIFEELKNRMNFKHIDLGSIMGNCRTTLYSIFRTVEVVNLADTFTLLRKFKDDMFLFIYFLRLSNMNEHDVDSIEKLKVWNKHVKNAFDWSSNQMRNVYSKHIISLLLTDPSINKISEEIGLFKYFDGFTKTLNNHAHSNGISFLNKLNPEFILKPSLETFEFINQNLNIIMGYLFSIIFYLSDDYLMDPEYNDLSSIDITPEENLLYKVSPMIQGFIDNVINRIDPKLKTFLVENTAMNIE